MRSINVDFMQKIGEIKPEHSVNNGPICPYVKLDGGYPMGYSNQQLFKDAGIPFVRNHDASFCNEYGGEHCVDVNSIFPDFDADDNDPAAYDFTLTDKLIADTMEAGSQIFYRLGSKIEHWIKKYNTLPPKDFDKWARICEHIVMHYNEGWANGFRYNIKYWEIWNEPDGSLVCGLDGINNNKPTWGGTLEQFVDLYCTVAKRLKTHFPDIKVGGPSASTIRCDFFWEKFLVAVKERDIPLDFLSWHLYNWDPKALSKAQNYAKTLLKKYGFDNTESILNEYNYVKDWFGEGFIKTCEKISSHIGAAYMGASFCEAQNSGLDMLMYYDARPSVFNGMFDEFCKPKKTYYAFKMFNEIYKLKNGVKTEVKGDDIYAVAATDGKARGVFVARFNEDDGTGTCKVNVSAAGINGGKSKVFVLDKNENMAEKDVDIENESLTLSMRKNSVILIMA